MPRSGPRSLLAIRSRRWLLAGVVVAAFVVTGVAVALPVEHGTLPRGHGTLPGVGGHAFSGSIIKYGCPASPGSTGFCSTPAEFPSLQSFPPGATVTAQWHTSLPAPVGFWVVSPDGQLVPGCSATGTNGVCSFGASSGSYEFNFSPLGNGGTTFEVDYQGTYT